MKIYIGADHRGFQMKNMLVSWMKEKGFDVEDEGAHELLPQDDYVDYAKIVGEKVSQDPEGRGVLLCGNGVGINFAVNKIKNIRGGLGFSEKQIQIARNDDDINVLSLPTEYISEDEAKSIITAFLQTPFANEERFNRRIEKTKELEEGS